LRNASDVTLSDIPKEFQDPKIVTFISVHMHSKEEKEILLSKVKEQTYKLLTECNLKALLAFMKNTQSYVG
jgi:hypothetical protein